MLITEKFNKTKKGNLVMIFEPYIETDEEMSKQLTRLIYIYKDYSITRHNDFIFIYIYHEKERYIGVYKKENNYVIGDKNNNGSYELVDVIQYGNIGHLKDIYNIFNVAYKERV